MRNCFVIVVLALIPVSFAHAQIPAVERDALIALYNSTDGANWDFDSFWLGAVGTECKWFGVTCAGGHVQSLDLVDNALSGSIPPELGSLSSLTHLYLFANHLGGSIPPELENLSSLRLLDLGSNYLSGGIQPELGNLSSLQFLWLSGNQLSGVIPAELGNLSILRQLNLGRNQLSGSIPAELWDLSGLQRLSLNHNQLSGVIPPELGNLSSLTYLDLLGNHLSGSIPAELGNLSGLQWLALSWNQLSGAIPAELGNLSSVQWLYLHTNQLSGVIPPELGNLSSVQFLRLDSNQLSGVIPAELGNLSTLKVGKLDLRWNALHSDDATLIAFLNAKHTAGGDWQSTQTIAPVNLTFDRLGDHTVWLSWDAVSYQTDPGGYSVFSAPTGTGIWTTGGWTEAKTDTTYPVTGLDPATIYDLAVVSYTDPHPNNLNLVNSDFSPQVMATTANVGCAQPIIQIAGVGPITLFVLGSYDSYLWSTGDTTSSIVIDPLFEQWYWVTVTNAGSCEETAATSVDPAALDVFADGFESGDTSTWSNTVP